MVSGSFHSAPAVLFTFPSRYFSTIGHWVVFRLGGWAPRILSGFLVSADTQDSAACLQVSSTWLSHPLAHFPKWFDYSPTIAYAVRTPQIFLFEVWPLPFSLATTHGISFDFSSSRYLDVSVPEVPHVHLCVQCTFHDSSSWVFPHSDISGSKLICSSPKLFAACHVLRRLPMPRHSPYALLCLNYLFKSDLWSHLKLFSLAWIAMSSYISTFYSYFSFVYFVWRNFNTFVTCFTNYGKTWFVSHFMFFPYLVCHVLLFGFQWASKPHLNFFRSLLSGFTTTKHLYLVFVKTGNSSLLGYGLKWTRTTDLALIRRAL